MMRTASRANDGESAGNKMAKYSNKSARMRRCVIAIVISYAVAIQSIIAGFPGIALPGGADENVSVFELCHGLNGDQNLPSTPSGIPGHIGGNHCIFCYAGSHVALGSPPPDVYH